jgi:hypothetical protein
VFEVLQKVEPVGDDVVRGAAVEVDYGTDAAVRALVGRVREPRRYGVGVSLWLGHTSFWYFLLIRLFIKG